MSLQSYPFVLTEHRSLRYVTFFALYVVQGVPAGFALTAVANYLAAEQVSPQAIGRFVAIVGLPWTVQFVWGPLIDRFQDSPMGRRRPWVLLAQFCAFLASLGILAVDNPGTQLDLLAAAFLCHSIFASVQDASVDAMAISLITPDERGRVNAFMRGGMLTGAAVGAAGLALLIRAASFQTAALAQSGLLLAMMLATFFLKERPGDQLFALPNWLASRYGKTSRPASGSSHRSTDADGVPHSLATLFRHLFQGLTKRTSLLYFGTIAVVYLMHSIFLRSIAIYLIQDLGWADTDLSMLSGTLGTVVALAVALAGGVLVDRLGARRMLTGVGLGNGIFLLAFGLVLLLKTSVSWMTGGMTMAYMLDPIFSVASFPILMALCRPGVEGSQFTTYMALINLADVAGAYVSGVLLGLISAPYITLLAGSMLVLNAFLIRYVIRQEVQEEREINSLTRYPS